MNKILIIEDDLEINALLADFLKEKGYAVHCQYDGLHVLDFLNKEKIDLIILDIMMPKVDGLEVCRKIREKVSVKETEVNINKLDKDTKTTKSSGEAVLSGAKYQILDKDRNELQIIDIDETNHQVIKNLSYGKYYIREVKAGTGYTIDNKIYDFEITKDNPKITLNLYNEVIKNKLIINKKYLIDETLHPEENIEFGIYDKDKNLVTKIITSEEGIAEITLPYGNYTIVQLTTTEGYDTIEPFNIIVENETELTYNLVNRKIKVPSTSSKELPFILKLINIILLAFV